MATATEQEQQEQEKTVVRIAREMLEARIEELKPAIQEFQEIEAMLNGMGATPRPAPRRRQTSSSSEGSRQSERYDEFLGIIGRNPEGIKVAQIAEEMGLKTPNYLYRLRDRAVREDKIQVEDGVLTAKK